MRLFCELTWVHYARSTKGSAQLQILRRKKLMSTQNTDINKGQESPPPAPGSFYTDNTTRQEKLSPIESFPQPPRRPPRIKDGYLAAFVSVIVVAAILFGVFAFVVANQGQHPV